MRGTDGSRTESTQRSSAKVPLSSYLILLGVMVLFLSLCLLITFDAASLWWIVPLLAAVSIVVGSELKLRERRARAAQRDVVDDRLLD
jgi:hypothetical protein